jgi:hypothetical protein
MPGVMLRRTSSQSPSTRSPKPNFTGHLQSFPGLDDQGVEFIERQLDRGRVWNVHQRTPHTVVRDGGQPVSDAGAGGDKKIPCPLDCRCVCGCGREATNEFFVASPNRRRLVRSSHQASKVARSIVGSAFGG